MYAIKYPQNMRIFEEKFDKRTGRSGPDTAVDLEIEKLFSQ